MGKEELGRGEGSSKQLAAQAAAADALKKWTTADPSSETEGLQDPV
jgi:dsRNA-specific ribonuclease